jgi:uncharacterized protein
LLHVLLHDAAEFVIGDLISPFKAMLADDYRQVENRLMTVVAQRFGLGIASSQLLQLTKKADRIAAFHEATVLAGFSEKDAIAVFGAMPKLPGIVATMLEPLSPREAKLRFLERFEALLKPAGT